MTSQWIITVEMMLENFASKMLLKSFLKLKMELQHVIKRISHDLWLDMIFIQPQTMGDPIYIYIYTTPILKYNYYIQFAFTCTCIILQYYFWSMIC